MVGRLWDWCSNGRVTGHASVAREQNTRRLSIRARSPNLRTMRRTRLYRLGLVFAAAFQLIFPTFASVADARAEAASERGTYAHVEDHSSSHCVPAHAADCTICRVGGGAATAGEAPVVVVAATRLVTPPLPRHELVAPSAPALHEPSQRAPPAA